MTREKSTKPSCCIKTCATELSADRQKKGKVKKVNRAHMQFDPEVNYETYLKKFRTEFQSKWNNVNISPSTGLEGFTEVSTLGKGFFGRVKLVKKNCSGDLYATKVLTKQKIISTHQVSSIFNEKRILYSIRFPYHTNLEFSRKDDKFLYLGMTLADGGELFLYHRRLGHFNEKEACFYAAQIFLALEYLHFMHLIYRDLKPENICLDAKGYVKIIDYGFTKYVPHRTLTLCGTPEYLAPEIIQARPYGESVDWWAFGILLYEFVAGHSPFSMYASNPMVMYEKICNGKFKMHTTFSSNLKSLVSRLLQPNLSKRIGVFGNGNADIKRHKWFKQINWYSLLNQAIPPPYIPSKKITKEIPNKKNSKSTNSGIRIQISDAFTSF